MSNRELPKGTVAFLFTGIEGSSELLRRPLAYAEVFKDGTARLFATRSCTG